MKKVELYLLYKEKYGYVPTIYDSDCVCWEYLEFDYSRARTKDLLFIYRLVKRDYEYLLEFANPNSHKELKIYKIMKALKKELNIREHIPNKLESRKKRQELFKEKKSR